MINLSLATPEIFMALAGMALLLFGVIRGDKSAQLVSWLAIAAMVVAGGLVFRQTESAVVFHDMFAVDAFRRFAKILVLILSGLSLFFAYPFFARTQGMKPEYPVLVLFATLGMMLMISAHDLIALYVGLELQNLALYVLVSFRRDEARSSEAGLKYFTLGALSSGILLFGLSLIYGFTGETSFSGITELFAQRQVLPAGLSLGIAFMIAGFAFKISAVPFHMWTPDVYEGAPTPVTSFLSTAPKAAALALLTGVLAQCLSQGGVETLACLPPCNPFARPDVIWRPLLIALSIASMALGSLAGLMQTNIKRLMAYSAIANIGTLMIGLVVPRGTEGLLIYLPLYTLATLGVLGGVSILHRGGKPVENIADFAGLSKSHPMLAFALAALLFSLAGIPPLAGFFGKYFVLLAAVQGGMVWLAVVGVLASVISAAYYLRVVKIMYFDTGKGLPPDPVCEKIPTALVAGLAVFVVIFVLYPAPLIEGARQAAESLILP